jgi:hypothetical protein
VDSCSYYNKMCMYVKYFRFFENLFKSIGVASYYSRSYTVLFSSVSYTIYNTITLRMVVYLTLSNTRATGCKNQQLR